MAAECGLHGAFGFPIVLEGEMFGVVEFFSHEIQQPDQELLQTMASLGNQLGQFIKRKRAEDELRASEARKAAMRRYRPGWNHFHGSPRQGHRIQPGRPAHLRL